MISPKNLAKLRIDNIRESIYQKIHDNLISILELLEAATVLACVSEHSKIILEIIKKAQ